MHKLFLLFSHTLTESQKEAAKRELKIEEFVPLPRDLQSLFSQVPPHLDSLKEYGRPILQWLASNGKKKDYVLIQGEFGLSYLLVQKAFELEMIPVYATTQRQVEEKVQDDGTVKKISKFLHVKWRKYGE